MENEYTRMVKSVDKVPVELRDVSERIQSVFGRIDHLKKVARFSDAGIFSMRFGYSGDSKRTQKGSGNDPTVQVGVAIRSIRGRP